MAVEMPSAVGSLLFFLENECGLSIGKEKEFADFGDKLVLLRNEKIQVRVLRDRGRWAVEIGSRFRPGDWYDIPLIIEYIRNEIGPDVIPFEEQTNFIKNYWNSIEDIFIKTDASEARAELDERRQRRVKRRFPLAAS